MWRAKTRHVGLEFQTKRNPYTKRIIITKENIKLAPCNRPGHHHRSIGNLHAFLQGHRQTSCRGHRQTLTLIIGTNTSPPLDLVTFNCLLIGNHPHRQLSCRQVTVASSADLHFNNPQVRVKRYVYKIGVNNYFCASIIINKYGLLHTINIIYMGLFIIIIMRWINMTNARINYARI